MPVLSLGGASGIEAACTRPLTAPAPTSAALPRNPLRENIARLLSMTFAGRRDGRLRLAFPPGLARPAAVDCALQVGLRQPERAPGVDRGAQRGDALPRLR